MSARKPRRLNMSRRGTPPKVFVATSDHEACRQRLHEWMHGRA